MKASVLLLGGLLMLGTGCGCSSSGTWEEDPKNYERAWDTAKPADVEMVHSWYWRSPHFTREEAYFFEFRKHEKLLEGFVSANNMQRASLDRSVGFTMQEPSWFIPKPIESYEAWSQPGGDAWLFRDKETGEIFIYACQL